MCIRDRSNELQLSQVLTNLLQNAILAIQEKESNQERRIELKAKTIGDKVILLIRDNGCGISKENLSKIYDPFFTSRSVGEGMGLGLSIVRQMLEGFKAKMDVESKINEFTEFRIEFLATIQNTIE